MRDTRWHQRSKHIKDKISMIPTIAALINARTTSSRLPMKLVLPFAKTTLIDIALGKLNAMDFFTRRYFGVAEKELRDHAAKMANIEVLDRDPGSVMPGYNDHRKIFAHYERIEADYIMWINPCHPLLSAATLRHACTQVIATRHNSYTSVIPTVDWIFDESGEPITCRQPTILSTAHSAKYYKVAHAFHVIRKEFFLCEYQYWTMTRNDPALIEIPAGESYDVNDEMEFNVAEAAYERSLTQPSTA